MPGYIDDFHLYGEVPQGSNYFAGKKLVFNIDKEGAESIEFFDADYLCINGGEKNLYKALPLTPAIYLVVVHQLAHEVPTYINYVVDVSANLVTKVYCQVTTVEKGSTDLTDTTCLVKRDIKFGYIDDCDPIDRHHYTHDLVDYILETEGNPGDTVRWYILSDNKMAYYQKEWKLGSNPIDHDGVGMGVCALLKIAEDIYVITLTKHSHGNQPFFLWNRKTGRYVADWAGVSRRLNAAFCTTGAGFMRNIWNK